MDLKNVKDGFVKNLRGLYSTEEAETIFFAFTEKLFGITRVTYLLDQRYDLSPIQVKKINDIIEHLDLERPYQHLIGEVEFSGLKLQVNQNVLIPRPETEELAQLIYEQCRHNTPAQILDVGTGSGCLALACAVNFPGAEVTAIDISSKALDTARQNARTNNLSLNFQQIDFLDEKQWPNGEWDLVVSNPPYITYSESVEMQKIVLDYEPQEALFVPDNDPLLYYRTIADFADNRLSNSGKVFLEVNARFAAEAERLFLERGYNTNLLKDLSSKDRFIIATK